MLGAIFGTFIGLIVGALGFVGAYLAVRFAMSGARDIAIHAASGAAMGVAIGWVLLFIETAASVRIAADWPTLILALVTIAGAFVGVWSIERRR